MAFSEKPNFNFQRRCSKHSTIWCACLNTLIKYSLSPVPWKVWLNSIGRVNNLILNYWRIKKVDKKTLLKSFESNVMSLNDYPNEYVSLVIRIFSMLASLLHPHLRCISILYSLSHLSICSVLVKLIVLN